MRPVYSAITFVFKRFWGRSPTPVSAPKLLFKNTFCLGKMDFQQAAIRDCPLPLQCCRSPVSQVIHGQLLLRGDWFNRLDVRNVVGSRYLAQIPGFPTLGAIAVRPLLQLFECLARCSNNHAQARLFSRYFLRIKHESSRINLFRPDWCSRQRAVHDTHGQHRGGAASGPAHAWASLL